MNLAAKQTRNFFKQTYVMRNFARHLIGAFHHHHHSTYLQLKCNVATAADTRLGIRNQLRFCHSGLMKLITYDGVAHDTLEDLADHFDYLADEGFFNDQYDLILADGVLTVQLGEPGTYVINKQTPNRQIWLSSPISGPKRYDFIDNTWIYSHEPGLTLNELLSKELSDSFGQDFDFTQLSHGKRVT